jgi:tetratricopeptide (TPR) repeat protein
MTNLRSFGALFVLVLSAVPLHGTEPWPLPLFSSDPKAVIEAADRRPASADVGIVILDLQTTIRFLAGGRTQFSQRTVYRLLNETGVERLSKLSQPWAAWRTDKPSMRARVITKDGIPHLLDPNTVTETGVPTQVKDLYTDVKVLTAPLPAVAPGAVVEAEVQNQDRETVNPGGVLEPFTMYGDVAIQFLKITLEVPADGSFHMVGRRMPKLDRKETVADGIRRVELTASDIPTLRTMALAPPEFSGNATLFVSDVPDWQQVAKWYSEVIERQIGVPAPAIDANTDAVPHMKEIESILADIQKQVRYTGMELGLAAFEPHAPSEVIARGYGDCKDKAALLVSRLRRVGIASTLALLNPYPTPDVAPDVPGMEAFSHAIVYVPGKHPLWIDPTAEFAPARRLPLADQGRLALIVDPHTRELVRTPESMASDNRILNVTTLTLDETGKSRVEMAHEEAGGTEDFLRPVALAASQLPEDRRDTMLAGIQQNIKGKVKNVDWGTPKDLDKPARFVVQAEDVPSAGTTGQAVYAVIGGVGESPLASLVSVLNSEKEDPAAKDRKEDYWLYSAFSSEERFRVVPPKGFRLKQLPKVADLPYGPLTIHRKVSAAPDGSVSFVYSSESSRRYTTAEAKSLRDAEEKIAVESFRLEFLSEGALLMSDGKWKEGIEKLRIEAEAPSVTVPALLRYAAALLEAGFRDDAIAVCRKAIALDPKSATAYARLSFLFRHDPAGRLDVPGNDLAEAEKAIRKAMELDPEDKQFVLDLATILEWKDPRERYADKTGLEEAINLLEGISKDLPGLEQTDRLPMDLFYARHFADMQSFYERPEGGNTRGDLRVAALAAREDAAAARREADRLFPNDADRQSVLNGAGQFLALIGEYSKAADMFHELTGTGSVSQSDLETLHKTHRAAEVKFSGNAVAAVVQHYILALCDHRSGMNYSDFLVPEWRLLTFNAQQNEVLSLLTSFRRIANMQLGTRATGDIVVSTVELFAEGSDATGYRVRFADPTRNGARKTIAWVVKRGGAYQVLGLAGSESTAGGEALDLAERGDLGGARRWLNWEREEITVPSSADSLAGQPFLRLWPPRPGVPERDQILAAAASLVARGHYYKDGIEALTKVHDSTQDPAFQSDLDYARADGLNRNGEYAEAAPIWRTVQTQHPDSEVALNGLGIALVRSGRLNEALTLAAHPNPDDDLFAAAQQIRARVFALQHKYVEAAQAYQAASKSSKAAPVDWNDEAWLTLLAPGVLTPDLEAANTANRMTQGRSASVIHTLGSVQAEIGQFKEARQSLVRYLGFFDAGTTGINASAHYLMGRIAEGISLRETAAQIYSAIPKPKTEIGDDAYDLAQIRLKVMSQAK